MDYENFMYKKTYMISRQLYATYVFVFHSREKSIKELRQCDK